MRRALERANVRIDHVGARLETERAIDDVLEELAKLFGADRAYIAEESEDRATAAITYECCASGVEPDAGRLGEMPSDAFPWMREQIVRGETVYVPVVDDLPPEASAERDVLIRRHTESMVAGPLAFGHQGLGLVAFEWVTPRRVLPIEGQEMLMVQGLLSAELQARQAIISLQRTNRVLRSMIECSDALLRADDELVLLEEVCRIIVEVGGYRLAWVGFGTRDERRSVVPVAKWGYDEGYLDNLEVTWANIELGKGPISRAVRTGLPVAVQSIATDPDFEPWRDKALERGYRSILAVSLDFGDELLGALGVYAGHAQAFDSLEIEMMQRFANYLAYGIVALRNRAQREVAEEQLRRTMRSKDELVASISHELRTPLTAVVGFAQLLREGHDLTPEDRAGMIRSIVDEGLDLSNIVEDLLTVAKAEAGTLAVVRVPVDLRAQAAQVFETLRDEDVEKVTIEGLTRRVQGDPGRVRQVLRNLVSNAIRYGGDKILIRIPEEGPPRIQVLDNGPGIALEDQQRIFESYQKAHDAPGLPGSVGLGLAISRTLARLMDGDLTYSYQDEMSVFELSFDS